MSAERALLDVVLPTHNVGPWLAASLESLRSQSLTSWHAYIVLDGCTDDSEKIARDFAARDARFSVHQAEQWGVGRARNLGFALGHAPYVSFVDPDDLVSAGGLAELIESLERTGSDLATGHAVQFREPSRNWPYWTMQSGLFDEVANATDVSREPRLILDHTTWNKVYRRAFLVEHDIRFPEDSAIGEDAHHTVEAICAATTVDVIPMTVYRHRVRPHSLTAVIRDSSSVVEWVRMTRSIESLVRARGDVGVTAVWMTRMLENEAWTRARHVGGMQGEGSLESLLGLLRELIAAMPDTRWAALPLTIRWAYEVLGVTATDTAGGFLADELAASVGELGDAVSLPEFERFERELKVAGTQLRAQVWRESLLLPFVRVVDRLGAGERRRAAARVLAFHDRFVAAHALLPGEEWLVARARAERYDELAHWAEAHRSMSGAADARPTSLGRFSVRARVHVPSDSSSTVTIVAVSQGRIAGLTRPLGGVADATGEADGYRVLSGSVSIGAIEPFGRWAFAAVVGTPAGGEHFIPLRLNAVGTGRMPVQLRTVVRVSALGLPLVIESKPGASQRATAKLLRHRIARGVVRRGRAALSRLGRRVRRV